MEEGSGVKNARLAMKVMVGLMAVALLVGMWFLAGAIANHGDQQARDRIVSQKVKETPALTPSDNGGEETSAAGPEDSSSSEEPKQTEAPDPNGTVVEKGKGASGEVNAPQDGGTATEAADFGPKKTNAPSFGDDNANAPYENAYLDMDSLIGVDAQPVSEGMSGCYLTEKGYVICDLTDGYSVILDTYHGGIFGVAHKGSDFTEEQKAKFAEDFPEMFDLPGANTLSGSYVLIRGQVNDLS